MDQKEDKRVIYLFHRRTKKQFLSFFYYVK